MRKALLIVGLILGLIAPGAALAAPGKPLPPTVICGPTSCDGGGAGSTGCWQSEWWSNRGIDYFSSIHHYIVAQWCKSSGTITSFSIVQHGCDSSGFASCSTGPAFVTGGGVGAGWVSFEGHANVGVTIPKALGYNLTDIVYGYISTG